jgi:hypothetical protein
MLGWYGVPGARPRNPQVHVVRGGRPICGTKVSPRAELQPCGEESAFTLKSVECARCLKMVRAGKGGVE